jgi:hypothetical protein
MHGGPRIATWAILAVYLALSSLVFFGGPLTIIATAICLKHGGTGLDVRLGFAIVGLVVGPLPIAVTAHLGQREIRRNPALHGKGRIAVAYACAALMAVPLFVGVAASLLRR